MPTLVIPRSRSLITIPPASQRFELTDFRGMNLSSGSGTSRSVTVPAGTRDGDLLVATVSVGSSGTTVTPPAGWTQLAASPLTMADASVLRAYTKIASGEGTTHDWTLTSDDCTIVETAYAGPVTNATPEVTGTQITNNSATVVAPSVTTTGVHQFLVYFLACNGQTTISGPGGVVNFRGEGHVPSQSGAVADELALPVGATATRTFDNTGGGFRHASVIVAAFGKVL